MVPPGDRAALAAEIRRARDGEIDLDRCGAAGRAFVEQNRGRERRSRATGSCWRDSGRARRSRECPLRSHAVTAVLFTCAGQRVDIVTAFGRAGATTIAADLDRLAPALYHADHMALVPRVTDPGYLPRSRRSSPSTTSSSSFR